MSDDIQFYGNDECFTAQEYVQFFRAMQPDINLDEYMVEQMLAVSVVVTARRQQRLLGFIRIITDRYVFGAVAEIRTVAEFHNDHGFFRSFLTAAVDACPTRLLVGNYRLDPGMMEEIGWRPGVLSYVYVDKPRVVGSEA